MTADLSSPMVPAHQPLLVVLSGPSGVGKDATLAQLRQLPRPWYFAVTATTRPPRSSEVEGQDYFFVTRERFQEMDWRGELLEHAEVYGNLYGVPRQQLRDALAKGHDVFLKVDVQGAATVRRLVPEAVLLFLSPGSMDELRQRLEQRHTDFGTNLERRLQSVRQEMAQVDRFDYCVVNRNGHLDGTVSTIDAIVTAEHCRMPQRQVQV